MGAFLVVQHLVHGRLAQVHAGCALAVMGLNLLGSEDLLWGERLMLVHIRVVNIRVGLADNLLVD